MVAGPSRALLSAELVPEAALSLQVEKQRLWMWCGRSERRTNAHYDPYEGFVRVIKGKKRFSLLAPWEMEAATEGAADRCQEKEMVLDVQEGELLYIPAFYHHSVVSTGREGEAGGCGEVLSVTSWFSPAGPLQRRLATAAGMPH